MLLMTLVSLSTLACKEVKSSADGEQEIVYDQELSDELVKMRETDQIAAFIPQGKYKELSEEQWKAFKDSVFEAHQKRAEAIFREHGYPGYDLVGAEGEQSFFLIVQHSNHNTDFQKEVLEELKRAVDNENADPRHYALLVDRHRINTGRPQIYGTQTTYRKDICQAIPKRLADSAGVDQRRKEVGLPPLKEYLNRMTLGHFEMNKQMFLARGITEPTLYEVEQQ